MANIPTKQIVGSDSFYRGTHREFLGGFDGGYLYRTIPVVTEPPMTVMAWVRSSDLTDAQIIWKTGPTDGTGGKGWNLSYISSGIDTFRWEVTDEVTPKLADSSVTVVVDRWYHVAAVERVDGTRSIFVDGFEDVGVAGVLTIDGLGATTIGAAPWIPGSDLGFSVWEGPLAWVSTHAHALEPWEIRQAAAGRHPATLRPSKLRSCAPVLGRTPAESDLVLGSNAWTIPSEGGTSVRLSPPKLDKYGPLTMTQTIEILSTLFGAYGTIEGEILEAYGNTIDGDLAAAYN